MYGNILVRLRILEIQIMDMEKERGITIGHKLMITHDHAPKP